MLLFGDDGEACVESTELVQCCVAGVCWDPMLYDLHSSKARSERRQRLGVKEQRTQRPKDIVP